jgi:hypothetical protein
MVEDSLFERQQLVDELLDAVLSKKIVVCPPVKEVLFSEVDAALTYDHSEHVI